MSRPRKIVVLWESHEVARRVRTYLLELKGYRVLPAASATEALEVIFTNEVVLVLAEYLPPMSLAEEFVRCVKRIDSETNVLLFSEHMKSYVQIDGASGFLPASECTPVALVERVRILTSRKRGPKKPVAKMWNDLSEAIA